MMDDLPVYPSQPSSESPGCLPDPLRALAEQFRRNRNPGEYLAARTALVDEVVAEADGTYLARQLSFSYALLAVGGYGRRELFPYSDIDLLLLVANEAQVAAAKEPLSAGLRALWDAGLRLSHSVRTVDECCTFNEQNVELHISLLDARFLTGERALFDMHAQKLLAFYAKSGQQLARQILEMAAKRHLKFNDTVYHLEPNIKDSPGGLRDFHLLRWLARLTPQHGSIYESVSELDGRRRDLFSLRCFLHLASSRDNNLLTFELQDEVARSLPPQPVTPEEWMRSYFANARTIFGTALRAADLVEAREPPLLRQFQDWRGRLSTNDFTVLRERIYLRNPPATLSSPEALLKLFTFAAQHGLRLSWDAHRRLRADHRHVKKALSDQPVNWKTWREFFSQPHCARALTEMHETGVLAAAIPEWDSIDSLVVRDFYHRYTVDEHTLVAISTIDRLTEVSDGVTARFAALLREEDEAAILRFALLLHDIGKGTLLGQHVLGSLQAAAPIVERMQMPEPERETIFFLIEHHLELSCVMNGRDVEDPMTARQLAANVGTQERLRRLTLLTFADISAVNATAMSPWRLEQLWRVYALGEEQLTRELVTDRIPDRPDHVPGGSASDDLADFLKGFPKRYLRTHLRQAIEHHSELSIRAKENGVAVEIGRHSGTRVLTALADDSPGLFAALCGTLASFGMNIVKAEAFSNASGMALDEFRFADPLGTLELNPEEIERLRVTIEKVVKGTIDVRQRLNRRKTKPRPSRGARICPTIRFNNEVSEDATLIDFTGEDRPGLLYDLASALNAARCNIELVMINTEAHKAIDVLYVTRDGRKLIEAEEEQLRQVLIEAANGEITS